MGKVRPAAGGPLHERSRWIYEHLPEGIHRLLDAGCHDGAATGAFATRAEISVGVDLNIDALRAGGLRCRGLHLAAANAAALPFSDSAFDCVVLSEVLEHLPSAAEERCVAELRRVTRPGGTLLLTTPHRGTFWWLDPLMVKTHLRRMAAAARGRRADIKGHKHYTLEEVQRLLSPHFRIRSVHRVGRLLYPLAYWGYLLPMGLGRVPALARLWQYMMDYDYSREYGDAAYNLCIVAHGR